MPECAVEDTKANKLAYMQVIREAESSLVDLAGLSEKLLRGVSLTIRSDKIDKDHRKEMSDALQMADFGLDDARHGIESVIKLCQIFS